MKTFTLLLTLVLTTLANFAVAQYKFSSLDYPGGTKTFARGINNRGDIIGAYRIVPPRHALLINNGRYIPLASNSVLGGTNFSEAFKINDRGDVVGDYDDGVTHGFLLHKGVLSTLDFPGADATISFGINRSGVVVGEWDIVDAQGNLLAYHGFIWKDGAFSDVNFPGSADTSVIAINEDGDYVGLWDSDVNSPIGHAFVYSKGQFTSFDVPGSTLTEANDLNEDGRIVGFFVDADGVTHGFLKVRDSLRTIDYPGAVHTELWGINSADEIVGIHIDSVGALERGFIARPHEPER
jgi:uncharacterized membrane protein